MNPQTPDNEVALSESVWGAYWPDWESRAKAMKMACEKLEEEVDRLRGLLKDHATFLRKNGFDRQADDLMRHAPTPEEPVSLDPAPKFTHEGNGDAKVKQPEVARLRELLNRAIEIADYLLMSPKQRLIGKRYLRLKLSTLKKEIK